MKVGLTQVQYAKTADLESDLVEVKEKLATVHTVGTWAHDSWKAAEFFIERELRLRRSR